ncbi:MAG TPA: hypothetical protein PLF40_20220, partial [Kofleriaceae bacterium]|nr:hypothetical protein [Kofleriaceae bacterium]
MAERPKFPPQVPFIIGNEACERFSFYGMRNILQPFLAASLLAYLPLAEREGAAKDVFHIFVMGVYFFPLLGGFIADRILGKYRTIFALSLVYCVGHGLLAAFESNEQGFYAGLFLIALGSGGIKPLVSSFVGDQFDRSNKSLAKVVYEYFYWSINLGSFFASLIMPKLLKGQGASIAFAVPGVLMFIATVIFVAGRKRYVLVPPPERNPDSFLNVIRTALLAEPTQGDAQRVAVGRGVAVTGVLVACAAIVFKIGGDWVPAICLGLVAVLVGVGGGASIALRNALGKHSQEAIDGVRSVLRILVLFAFVTPFWSLFDQKATTWVIQAKAMSKPSWFEPAMMQALNP